MKNILIIGANSKIASECAKLWAYKKNNLFLISRNKNNLKNLALKLKKNGSNNVKYKTLDVNLLKKDIRKKIEKNLINLSKIDLVLFAFGELLDNDIKNIKLKNIHNTINLNGLITCKLIYLFSKIFLSTNKGTIATITSVSGDVIKKSNFIYGSSKSIVSNFIIGLRSNITDSKVKLIDIKPGFVITPMTKKFKKNILWSDPYKVAQEIVSKIDDGVENIYTPFYWRYIMAIVKLLPSKIQNKL